jgi:hypothetical protein
VCGAPPVCTEHRATLTPERLRLRRHQYLAKLSHLAANENPAVLKAFSESPRESPCANRGQLGVCEVGSVLGK